MIGIAMILLGMAAGGVLADAAVENASTGSRHAVDLFGQTLHPSTLQLAVAGAILGAATVVLIGMGLALLVGRRRNRRGAVPDRAELERQVEHLAARARLLESQNAALTQENSALREQAEELEGRPDGPGAANPDAFGPPARQVSKTALISVPPAPAPPGGQSVDHRGR
jgi:hypothetical protein